MNAFSSDEGRRLIRGATRQFARSPRFSLTVAATLALGIGLATAVFAVMDAVLLQPLPVVDQNRLVMMSGGLADGSVDHWPLTLPQAREFTRRTRTLSGVGYAAYEGAWPSAVRDGDGVTRLRRALVSGNFFDVLGARAVLGRGLRPSDDVVGGAPVVVLSHRAWRTRFGGDSNVVGRKLPLIEWGTSPTIVGVMPPGLEYPAATDFWAPFVPSRLESEDDTKAYTAVDLIARVAPGSTPAAARAELKVYFNQGRESRELRAISRPFADVVLGNTKYAVMIFAAAAALLLVITCLDVANLLFVRGLDRVREIAVRRALGGSRIQVVTQLMTENALLALAGGALGVGIAIACVGAFRAFAPQNIPLLDRLHVSTAILTAAIGITTFATLAFGLAPAFITARIDVQSILRSGPRQSQSRGMRRTRDTLMSAQLALAALMLFTAALIGRSFSKLRGADLRFDASRVIVAELAIRFDQYDDVAKQTRIVQQVVAALQATNGVDGVSPVVAMPFSGAGGWTGSARKEGQTNAEAAKNPMLNIDVVTPDYFSTMGLRVLRGRSFTNQDRRGSELVVVVSQAMARLYWPNADPIGQRLLITSDREPFTVVGVVDDIRYRDLRVAQPSVYHALAQSMFPFAPTTLVIRTSVAESSIVPMLRRAIKEVAPGVELATAYRFEHYMEAPLAQPRLNAFLLGLFATSAALLAAIGLGGVVATAVQQRTHEIGVRMALGATGGDVQRMLVKHALVVAEIGVAIGIAIAVATGQVLDSMLFDVSPTDPGLLVAVTAFLSLIVAIAALWPARRSGRIDPVVALRADG
jgi:predicted permease